MRRLAKTRKKDNNNDEDRVNATSVNFLLVEEFESTNLIDSSTTWVIDSGVPINISFTRDLFISYAVVGFGNFKMAHEGVAKCVGVGQVCLENSNDSGLILKHVPNMWLNLLSVGKLCDENYNNLF